MEKWLKSKFEPPELNYLEVFKIHKNEETYTRFLEWLFNPKSNHNLLTKPLILFLTNIVSNDFPFDLKREPAVEAEKNLKEGTVDIQIKGENFFCIIENKIHAREGYDQTQRYYNSYIKEHNKSPVKECPCKVNEKEYKDCTDDLFKKCPSLEGAFFIFLTLTKSKTGPKCRKFDNILWKKFEKNVLIKLLELQQIKNPVKEIIKTVVYNLQGNENPKMLKYFDNIATGIYDKNLLAHYLALKDLKSKDTELEKV